MRNFRGFMTRGNRSWAGIQGGILAWFSSCGVKDFDQNLNSTIDTERAVSTAELYIKTIKEAGPPDWTSVTWYDNKQRFTAGLTGIIMDNVFFAASFEDPEVSEVVGKVGYAPVPAGPDGKRVTNLATWGLAMNSQARNPEATWLFMQLATSKEALLESCCKYHSYMPPRLSTWYNPKVITQTRKWGVDEWKLRKVHDDNIFTGRSRVVITPTPAYAVQGDLWMTALHEIHQGAPAKETLSKYARKIEEALEEIGLR
ncbi:Erythritol/L-threitol-binding protein [subsurface metagenome]